jgi:MFS family permease
VRDPHRRLFLIASASMFVFGTLTGLPGALLTLPDVVEGLQLTLADRGTLIASVFTGMFGGSVLSGPVTAAMGTRRTFVASAVLMAVCLPLMGLASSFGSAAAALAAAGFAAAGVNTTSNVLVSDAYPEARGHRLAIMSVAVAAGGVAMPLAAGVIAGRLSWHVLVFAASAVATVVAVVAFRLHAPASSQGAPIRLRDIAGTFGQPGFGAMTLLALLGAANDVTMAGWTSTFLLGQGFTPSGAAGALSSYWFGLIAGRLALSRFVDRDKLRAIAAAAGGGAVLSLLWALASAPVVLTVMPFFIGVANSLLVPTALAAAAERHPRSTGLVFGLMMTATQVGAMGLPSLVGVVAEGAGLRLGMALLVVTSAVMAVVAWRARQPPAPPPRP